MVKNNKKIIIIIVIDECVGIGYARRNDKFSLNENQLANNKTIK